MTHLNTPREPHFGPTNASLEDPRVSLSDPNAYTKIFGTSGASDAGVIVSPQTAMRFAAVFACVRVRGETLASMPLQTFRRTSLGKVLARDNPLYYKLHERPNSAMSSATWRKLISSHLDLWGNHYSQIVLNRGGAVDSLKPFMPWEASPRRLRGGSLVYDINSVDGSGTLSSREILHIPGMGFDGERGYSPIDMERNAIGIGIAADAFAGNFFKNDARPGVVIETPANITKTQAEEMKAEMNQKFGPGKKWSVATLGPGLKLHAVTMPLDNAQFLETRKYQVAEVARIYRVPPHMIGDLEKATFSNIEQQDIGFAKHTMLSLVRDIEQELNFKLFSDRNNSFAEFNLDGLMRGDFKSRMEGYQIGVNTGIWSRSEVRELENFEHKPELDPFVIQGAMVTVNKDGTLDKPVKPANDMTPPDKGAAENV